MIDVALLVIEVNGEIGEIITRLALYGINSKVVLDFHIVSFLPGNGSNGGTQKEPVMHTDFCHLKRA